MKVADYCMLQDFGSYSSYRGQNCRFKTVIIVYVATL